MFAAAAVAAAAALTAITTTQTCDPDQINKASTNGKSPFFKFVLLVEYFPVVSKKRLDIVYR